MKLVGETFRNSNTCEGVTFASKRTNHDIATVTISGRYPEEGWSMNEASDEIVYVSDGKGKLICKDEGVQELEKGDGAFVEAGIWFAWEGDMTIVMSCSPAFNSEQYRWKEQ
ncbi:MAG: Cupin domain protein [Candidatus Saccharibacteria bacterium]|nr:Cupin domain protein [Candidatus Saccharibacteria bacterium]